MVKGSLLMQFGLMALNNSNRNKVVLEHSILGSEILLGRLRCI